MLSARPIVLLPYKLDANIYVRELGRAYHATGADVVFGFENMFEPCVQPTLLHLHWPELYRSAPAGSEREKAQRLLSAIDTYRQGGAKVVWSVHNLAAHERSAEGIAEVVYQGVIDRTDLIVHHCARSVSLLSEIYRVGDQTAQIVVPHGHYLAYPRGVTRADARRWLGIPDDAFVYLHFGNIRGYKGLDDLFDAFDQVSVENKWLLVAGRYASITGEGGWRDRWLMWRKQRLGRRMTLRLTSVPDDRIQHYMAACDCTVLAHRQGLNSGVAVLAMTFGRPVVGPDIGCIGEVLRAGKNVLYKTGNAANLAAAMAQVSRLDPHEVEARNSAVAASWTWDAMAEKVLHHPAVGASSCALASNVSA